MHVLIVQILASLCGHPLTKRPLLLCVVGAVIHRHFFLSVPDSTAPKGTSTRAAAVHRVIDAAHSMSVSEHTRRDNGRVEVCHEEESSSSDRLGPCALCQQPELTAVYFRGLVYTSTYVRPKITRYDTYGAGYVVPISCIALVVECIFPV